MAETTPNQSPEGSTGQCYARAHHYHIAYSVLWQEFFGDPRMLGVFYGNSHVEYASRVYDYVCENLAGSPDFGPEEIELFQQSFSGLAGGIVSMPEARFPTEARYIAFVPAPSVILNQVPRPRMFTLEFGKTVDGDETSFLCEWTQEKRHVNYGEVADCSLDDFCEAVSAIICAR